MAFVYVCWVAAVVLVAGNLEIHTGGIRLGPPWCCPVGPYTIMVYIFMLLPVDGVPVEWQWHLMQLNGLVWLALQAWCGTASWPLTLCDSSV